MKKLTVRVVASKPKKTAPFAPDLALFEFTKVGRAFECEGFRAMTQEQLARMRPSGNPNTDPVIGGWWTVTPAQRDRLVQLAREHAPYWSNVRAEVA